MSLINDALRRARNERPKDTGVSMPPARPPLEKLRQKRSLASFLPLICLALLLMGAGLLLWQWFKSSSEDLKIRASGPSQALPVSPTPVAQPAQAVPAATPSNAAPDMVSSMAAATTNVTPVAESPKAEPMTYQLQSIFYRARNPSAVINGKTVFLGERVGGAKVLAIDKDSVTILLPNRQTNILDLQ